MLVIKYTKTGSAKYIPHVDMLRQTARILRRANIKVAYSQGFNPHELIFFAPPTPLGIESTAEYCTIFTDEKKDDFIDKFNAYSIDGIKCLKAAETSANPNLAGKTEYAKYTFTASENVLNQIDLSFKADKYEISYMQKGELVKKDVRSLMKEFGIDCGTPYVVLAFGNTTLRADRFLGSFGIEISDVVKTDVYYRNGADVVSADSLFD